MARAKAGEWVKFTVTGVGPFPVDMMRFEECWPEGIADANAIERSFTEGAGRVQVRLCCEQTAAMSRPTAKRWESFNWRVVPDDAA